MPFIEWRRALGAVLAPVMCLSVSLLLVAPAWAGAPQSAFRLSAEEQRRMCCGPNSLYLFLRLMDVELDYEAVASHLIVGADGCSLADLRQAAFALGVPCSVVRTDSDNLPACTLPWIAHLKPLTVDSPTGHYVVVVGIDGDACDMLDGTTGLARRWKVADFAKAWSGYALVRAESPITNERSWVVVLCISIVVWTYVYGVCATRARATRWRGSPGAHGSTRVHV
jgi:Peptidase C39 family